MLGFGDVISYHWIHKVFSLIRRDVFTDTEASKLNLLDIGKFYQYQTHNKTLKLKKREYSSWDAYIH